MDGGLPHLSICLLLLHLLGLEKGEGAERKRKCGGAGRALEKGRSWADTSSGKGAAFGILPQASAQGPIFKNDTLSGPI